MCTCLLRLSTVTDPVDLAFHSQKHRPREVQQPREATSSARAGLASVVFFDPFGSPQFTKASVDDDEALG